MTIFGDIMYNNIKESNISSPPSIYEAYLYRYINLKNDKTYVGIHKGSVDDSYNHSSSNKEFQEVFSSSDSELKFEVPFFGSYNEMMNREHQILSEVDARNNPLFYNKTNGYPAYKELNLQKCLEMNERIDSDEFYVGKEDIKIHEAMTFIQVRFANIPELQHIVKGKVDDANGNTDECEAVLVWEKRGENGEDKRGDGNHTVFGVASSKHGIDVPVKRVPYEEHCHLSDEEIAAIGRLRNKRSNKVKYSNDAKTGLKHLLDNHVTGEPVNTQSNRDWLKAFGFTTSEIKTMIKKAKSIIDKNALRQNNLLWINYKAAPHSAKLADTVQLFGQNEGMCSIYMSSLKFSVDRIIETLWAATKIGKRKIMVVIHHPSPEAETNWKTVAQPNFINLFKTMLKDNLEVRFHEMTTTMSDGTKD